MRSKMTERILSLEKLEDRRLLHADVNLDNQITAADALSVINHIGEPALYANANVNGDDRISSLDALVVINILAKPPPTQIITITLGKLDVYGISPDQVKWAINESIYSFENQSPELDIRFVNSGGTFHLSSGELYLGNGVHARGWNKPGLGGHILQFHDGTIAPGHSRFGTRLWNPYGVPLNLMKIVRHEVGHGLFRWGHTSDKACVMHVDASAADFCMAEISRLK